MIGFDFTSRRCKMLFEIDINQVYVYLLKRYTIVIRDYEKKCKCSNDDLQSSFFIPIKREKDKLFMNGYCCNFSCMLDFLDHKSDMVYRYTYNILWTILPFMIAQTDFL